MIDLHTHTLLSDGELLPSELVRRAHVIGYEAIALTDHVDSSNIDFVISRIVKVCAILNSHWEIRAIPGVEITHAPLEEIVPLVRFARKNGARLVMVHGETVSEPVIRGTNRSAIEAGCDILAHPGLITEEDLMLAKKKGVYLELTARKSHRTTNRRLLRMSKPVGARLVLNTDAHSPDDLMPMTSAVSFLRGLRLNKAEIKAIFANSRDLVAKITAKS